MATNKISPEAKLLAEFKGIKIYGVDQKSKTGKGKDRVWIQLRQEKPEEWKQTATLAYMKAADIQFQK